MNNFWSHEGEASIPRGACASPKSAPVPTQVAGLATGPSRGLWLRPFGRFQFHLIESPACLDPGGIPGESAGMLARQLERFQQSPFLRFDFANPCLGLLLVLFSYASSCSCSFLFFFLFINYFLFCHLPSTLPPHCFRSASQFATDGRPPSMGKEWMVGAESWHEAALGPSGNP